MEHLVYESLEDHTIKESDPQINIVCHTVLVELNLSSCIPEGYSSYSKETVGPRFNTSYVLSLSSRVYTFYIHSLPYP